MAAKHGVRPHEPPRDEDPQRKQLVSELMSALAVQYLPLVPELRRPKDCTITLWACAKSDHWGDGLAAALLARLAAGDGELMQRAEGRNLGNLWWSLSSGAPAELLAAPAADTALCVSRQRLLQLEPDELAPQVCSNVLIAAARLQRGPEALWDHMTRCLADVAPDAKSQELANCLHSLGSLAEDCGHTPRQQDLKRLEAEVGLRLEGGAAGGPSSAGRGFNPQETSNMLWGLAKLRRTDSSLLRPLAEAAGRTAVHFTAQNLSISLWALATLGCSSAEYGPAVRALIGAARRLLQQQPAAFKAQELSNILLALATLQKPINSEALIEAAAAECRRRGFLGFTPQAISNAAWALAKMPRSGPEPYPQWCQGWYEAVVQAAMQLGFVGSARAQEWSNLLYAQGLVQHRPPAALLILAVESTMLRTEANAQDCANSLWSLAHLYGRLELLDGGSRTAVEALGEQWLPQLGRSVDAVVELEGGRQLAVEVDGPSHFLANGEHRRTKDGSTQLRDRQLERVFGRGNVLSVPYWEWRALRGGKVAQEEYLCSLLMLGLGGSRVGIEELLSVQGILGPAGGRVCSYFPLVKPAGGHETRPGSGRGKAKSRAEGALSVSAHERRLARMQERIAELEADALRGKSWHLIGEATAGSRPINSALELDMDFETTAKPVPVQTDEMTNDLEALIRKRIADRRFDDVIRVVPPPLEPKKKVLELDDSKSKAGLGELYEQDYVRQVAGGTAEDKDEKLRAEARALFKALSFKLDALSRFHFAPKPVVEDMTVRSEERIAKLEAEAVTAGTAEGEDEKLRAEARAMFKALSFKLDALSRLHFAPKPVVEDMTVRSEVPAIAMDEAAPVAVSKAAMAAPEEVYRPGTKDGRPQAEGELTRPGKDGRTRSSVHGQWGEGGTVDIVGRKSDNKVRAVKKAVGSGGQEGAKKGGAAFKL
ncbi:hypothetical protein GPECTOR_8g29 [Gonium pectorale]|uniref:RAP domain-containing protein n=1 Tax=Gonium pectorale TaxID=33097 RepID=A0A150GSX4_GONPE|nr:hypothetical protein GPECTOR_8g29 [Gonium pectorale]|eukprot:KXZ52911.1 hypothetical protein GPECTOR_8g29 [Gonium pectorale]